MHVLGHVFIWLIALGALVATVLSAKTYDIRNSWSKKVDQLQQDVEKNKPIIAEKQARLKSLQAELDAKILGWGEPFPNVGGQLNDSFQLVTQDPALTGWLGSLDPAQQGSQVVYVFQPQEDGSSLYIGSFQPAGPVQPGGNAVFNPTWTPRNDDFAAIQNPSGPFRVRPMVPAHFPSKYADLRGQISITERLLGDKQHNLATQKLREADAKAIRDQRTNQLQGPEGYVAQLQSAEDERNVELEEEDHWRRKVNDARQEIDQLMKTSRDLQQQIRESETPESTPPDVTARVTRR
jgi:hypothetical protein